MPDTHILVVEDDQDGQEVIARMLKYHRIPFHMVFSGEEALESLSMGHYTGAIFDLALPGMDGWTLLENVKSNPRTQSMPCVAVTAFHSADVAIKAIEAGFVAYFSKPLESTTFVRELQRVLG